MKVFVIEDNPVYNDYVCNLLKKDSFDTMSAYNLATAKKLLAKSEVDDIVVADLRLPDGESIELLRWMRANDKQQVFIVMTNYGEVHTAVESMKLGSKDYIQKQLLEDKLIPLIRTLQKEHEKRLQWNIPIFVRQGEAYQKIKKRVRLVATTRMSVLILGENGTGKEHIAQHIHQQSKLADKPFVAVDCGALSPSLIQSAFFGHVKGAFTGAEANKTGYFLEADGGTLFLDEVGNLTMEMQQMLLRAIQERRYRPVGAKEDKTANVRIVAATNEDLQKAVGGDIEATYPFNEPVALVMHDEGKLVGKELNRALRDDDGDIYDIIAGDFLVVGLGEDDFCSLSPELMKQFEEHFHQPETFVRMGRSIMALPLPDDMVKKEDAPVKADSVPHKSNPDRDVL